MCVCVHNVAQYGGFKIFMGNFATVFFLEMLFALNGNIRAPMRHVQPLWRWVGGRMGDGVRVVPLFGTIVSRDGAIWTLARSTRPNWAHFQGFLGDILGVLQSGWMLWCSIYGICPLNGALGWASRCEEIFSHRLYRPESQSGIEIATIRNRTQHFCPSLAHGNIPGDWAGWFDTMGGSNCTQKGVDLAAPKTQIHKRGRRKCDEMWWDNEKGPLATRKHKCGAQKTHVGQCMEPKGQRATEKWGIQREWWDNVREYWRKNGETHLRRRPSSLFQIYPLLHLVFSLILHTITTHWLNGHTVSLWSRTK